MTTDTPPGSALVNGDPYPLPEPVTIDELVRTLVPGCVVDGTPQGVAVALDDAVVPRGAWTTTHLRPGDRAEVLTAVQGG
ncbi:sulfur carrier protein ThiS [Isoptericola sp. BMS4]|uniref:sulfur carrier protein ThiS n=1 Tax=Isoptericola sp. BMS4 TaxID=2527875 RepID=UPI001423BFE6|nr:sulfur carrier protein ThiS [Isoptericola sp. BMS4]